MTQESPPIGLGLNRGRIDADSSDMARRGYVAALVAVVLGAALVLASIGIHRWRHDRAVARYAAGERALASLSFPSQFQPVDETDCHPTPDIRCLHLQFSPLEAASRFRAVVPSAAAVDPAECQSWEVPVDVRCTFVFSLGGHPAEATIYPRIVLLPARVAAPPGVQLVAPGLRFHSYYDGAMVSVGLVGGPPS